MNAPSIILTIDPTTDADHNVEYLRLAATAKGVSPTRMLALRLNIVNQEPKEIWLQTIKIEFPSNPELDRTFTRDETSFKPGVLDSVYPADDESMRLPAEAPSKVRVELFFKDFADPVIADRDLVPHDSDNPLGAYHPPFHTDDMRWNEYVVPNATHVGGGQHFAYDIHLDSWDPEKGEFTSLVKGSPANEGDPGDKSTPVHRKNEDSLIWDRPVRAMADGVVIQAKDGSPNNPAPGVRALLHLAEHDGGALEAVDLTALSPHRMLAAVKAPGGTLVLSVFEQSDTGEKLDVLATSQGAVVTALSATAISAGQAVLATIDAKGALSLSLWSFSAKAKTLSSINDVPAGQASEVQVVSITSTRVAVASRTASGPLVIRVWDIDANKLKSAPSAVSTKGATVSFSAVSLSKALLATAVRTSEDKLKIILWSIADDGTIVRGTDIEGGPATRVAAALNQGSLWTASAAPGGGVRMDVWKVDGAEDIALDATLTEPGDVSLLRLSPFKRAAVATADRTSKGTIRITFWDYSAKKHTIVRQESEDLSAGDRVDITLMASENRTLAIALRTSTGKLRILLRRYGEGNTLLVRHGREVVVYAHLKQGTIEKSLLNTGTHGVPVKAGQRMAHAGNSGPATGPHLHVEATRLLPEFDNVKEADLDELLIQKLAAGKAILGGFNPLPFSFGLARVLKGTKLWSQGDLDFAKLDRQGVYFDSYVVWPGSTTPGVPTSRPEVAFHALKPADYQTIHGALLGAGYHLVWIDGYAVAGDVRYNAVFHSSPAASGSDHHGLTGAQYQDAYDAHKAEGKRLVHVNSYAFAGEIRYAAIFRKADGVDIVAYHGRSPEEHQKTFDQLTAPGKGFVPAQVSVSSVGGKLFYAALYEKRDSGGVFLKSRLTAQEYDDQIGAQAKKGMVLDYVDAYEHEGAARYSAIWVGKPAAMVHAPHGLTTAQYQKEYDTIRAKGFRTRAVAGHSEGGASRLAGVWQK